MTTCDQEGPDPGKNKWSNLSAYRQSLIAAEQSMQAEYDKGVLTLSGGALAISLVFLKDVVGTNPLLHGGYLLAAWVSWGLSIAFVLSSYFTSTKALRRAITDTDEKRIYDTLAQSGWTTATKFLNALAGTCFFLGIIFFVTFVFFNLPK